MSVIEKIIGKAKKMAKRIVLPESNDVRVLKAAALITERQIADVILIGKKEEILERARKENLNLEKIEIINPESFEKLKEYSLELKRLRAKKGMTFDEAEQIMKTEERYFGAMMVRLGDADGMVAGSSSPTADVLRASIHVIGVKEGLRTVSSSFLMTVPNKDFGKDGVLMYSDCGVVPDPSAEQLADIAESSAQLGRLLGDIDPKVALLSFSTKGSAKHKSLDKIIEAKNILENRNVDFKFDGELQADAAIVPRIASKKAPDSPIKGRANVLVFPNLNAGNIAYKLTQRLTGGEAFGPLLQGLSKPVNDLSRGCSVEDIVNVAAITVVETE
ncbi:MAG: phosphate acetyltransferase [Fusobacteriota bacterium]